MSNKENLGKPGEKIAPLKEGKPGAAEERASGHKGKKIIIDFAIIAVIVVIAIVYLASRMPEAEIEPRIEIINVSLLNGSSLIMEYNMDIAIPIFLEENRMLCNALAQRDKAVCDGIPDIPNGTFGESSQIAKACNSMIDLTRAMESDSEDNCHFDEEPYNDPLGQLVCISSIRGDASICGTTPLPHCETIMNAFLGETSEDEMLRRLNDEDPEFAADFDASNFRFFKALITKNPATCDTMDDMRRDDISYFREGEAQRNKYICKAILGQNVCDQIR